VDHTGLLVEWYEYTPYGQRVVYSHGWNPADLTPQVPVATDRGEEIAKGKV